MKILLSVVTYNGLVEPETGDALKRSIQQLTDAGIEVQLGRWIGDSLIADARNGVVGQFMASDATDLIFIDHDVAWDGDELLRLARYPVDVVAGAYRKRVEPESYPVSWCDRPELQADPETGLLEVETVATGFLRLSRNCLHRMSVWYADRAYENHAAGPTWCLFDCGLSEGRYWGEDYTFCKRWRDTGGQVWIDPMMNLHHIGFIDPSQPNLGKRKFTGCIGDWLRNRQEAA